MRLAIANASTLVADDDVATIAEAVQAQLATVAAAYDREPPTVHVTGTDTGPSMDGCDVLIVVADDADQAGALGYHAETPDGHPYARVFARDSIAGLSGVDPASLAGIQPSESALAYVAQVVSHEAIEAVCDEHANDWADDGNGTSWAYETADPVESSTYTLDMNGHPVTVSDWVTPAFFDPTATAGSELDFLGVITAPLTIAPGGYAISESEGQPQETFGEALAPWRVAQHQSRHPASRTGRRFAAISSAAPAAPAETFANLPSEEDTAALESAQRAIVAPLVIQDNVTDPDSPTTTVVEGGTVVHDNVSTEGVQVHRVVDKDGQIVAESVHQP